MSRDGPPTRPGECIWVFHRGALGDSVLLWPRLREWVRAGSRVVLVSDRAKAHLAQREVGVEGLDGEQPRFNQLWLQGGRIEPEPGVQLVVDHVSGGSAVFASNLAGMFPGAIIRRASPPRGGRDAVRWAADHPLSSVAPRPNTGGPVVVHVGAGGGDKRWPMPRWTDLVSRWRDDRGWTVDVLAGEVEAEKLDAGERSACAALGGRFIETLDGLARSIRVAKLFVGGDTGPTHLAAQLGVPTLALFGPTDPAVWAPIGPAVRPVFPADPRPMDWLDAETLMREADALLSAALSLEGPAALPPTELG